MNKNVFNNLIDIKNNLIYKEEQLKKTFGCNEISFLDHSIENIIYSIYELLADEFIIPNEIPDQIFNLILEEKNDDKIIEYMEDLFDKYNK